MIIKSVSNGILQNLEDIPDEMFASKVMGDGVAIKPEDNWIFSPVDGQIIMIFETKHAIGIRAKDGTEVLIHIGVDTMTLHGEPFVSYVEVNDQVKKGELLMSSDYKKIENKGLCSSIMMIVTNKKVKRIANVGKVSKEDVVLETVESEE